MSDQPTPEQALIARLAQQIGAQAVYIAQLELQLDADRRLSDEETSHNTRPVT